MAQTRPRLDKPALLDRPSVPKPAMAVPPQSSNARPDRLMREFQIAAVPPQGELHENAVIHARAEDQRQRHEVEQIPRPAGNFHRRQQAKSAQQQNADAEKNFRQPPERQPERKQNEADHRQQQFPEIFLDGGQNRSAQQFPAGKPDAIARQLRIKLGESKPPLRWWTGIKKTDGEKVLRFARRQLFKNPRCKADSSARKHSWSRRRCCQVSQNACESVQAHLSEKPLVKAAARNTSSSASQPQRIRAIGGLKFRARPERSWQREAGERLVGDRGVELRAKRRPVFAPLRFRRGRKQPARAARAFGSDFL